MQNQNPNPQEFGPALTKVLREMCKRVGVDMGKVNFKEESWYTKHTWSQKEQDDFQHWLADQVQKDKDLRNELTPFPALMKSRVTALKFASHFILNYGWKVK